VLDLTAVMSSLLGKTGTNLRAAFDHAKANSAVLLLDEIDAIAKRRSDESDIGELKRLVTVILQEVDQWPDTGLLLAATNHPELVDPALWRRFEAVLEFGQAEAAATHAAIQRFLGDDLPAFEPWLDIMATSLREQSLSDVERSITTMRRAMALHDESAEQLIQRTLLGKNAEMTRAQRQDLAFSMAAQGQLSHHEISRLTGVSRDTIRKHVGPSPRQGRGLK
jgi:SpoVK/Ycf46/Vps4 family AAA+-type ATPase